MLFFVLYWIMFALFVFALVMWRKALTLAEWWRLRCKELKGETLTSAERRKLA